MGLFVDEGGKPITQINESSVDFLYSYMYDILKRSWRFIKVGDWEFKMDYDSGSMYWENKKDESLPIVYSTPFWEGKKGIQIEIVSKDGNTKKGSYIPFRIAGDEKEDLHQYVELIKKELSRIR